LVGALIIAALTVGLEPHAAFAAVWKRTRRDGTIEFTNLPPGDRGWQRLKGGGRGAPAGPQSQGGTAAPGIAAPAAVPAGGAPAAAPGAGRAPAAEALLDRRPAGAPGRETVIWSRENEDGTIEFTNLQPVGARWKVLYRTGPGKASALRGASDIIPPRDVSGTRFSRYDDHIRDQQAIYGVPPHLLKAVIKAESDFDPRVVSSAGAVGLTQLMPETARSMGVTNIWDPRQNIMGGARYLQTLARRFCRTPTHAAAGAPSFVCSREETVRVLAGYHAGPGAVEKYGGLPPYETTRAYVTSVLARYDQYAARARLPTPVAARAGAELAPAVGGASPGRSSTAAAP
jgi:soluble lytic murein transglycosylase-like protein